MAWTRRQMLELGAKLGLLSATPLVPGCPTASSDDDDSAIEPDPWPPFEGCDPEVVDYQYDGPQGPEDLFQHGVASGDPLADAVMLWTKVSPGAGGPPEVEVYWEIAENPEFAPVLGSGLTTASPARDWTVKAESTCLRPGRRYWYRFSALGRTSPVGRTKTAPYGEVENERFAFCSCSSIQHGYFHGYRAIAEREDLDLVMHLGDYIYEFANGEYGDVRDTVPEGETITLEDYRARHADNKRDADLQAAHAAHPWICTWDDHETADNSWMDGANNHDAGEGPWDVRRAAGEQAYFEYLPIREGAEGILYRRLLRGSLLDVIVLDTRLVGRDEEASNNDEAYDPDRQLLGEAQESWLLERLSESPSRWKLLAQQVVMGQWALITDDQGRPTPFNKDAWDGYQAARTKLLEHVVGEGIDGVVVLTGDVHSSWANDIAIDFTAYDPVTRDGAVAVEAVCPGITSPGFGDLAGALIDVNPHIRWGESRKRGFVVVDANPDRLQCDWYLFEDDQIEDPTYSAPFLAASFETRHGEPWWEEAAGPIGG